MAVCLWGDEEGAQIVSGVKTTLISCNVLSYKGDCKNILIHELKNYLNINGIKRNENDE